MKKKTYVLSKPTIEKADAVLKQMRIEQARSDLSKSNRRIGMKSLDVSSLYTTTPSATSTQASTQASTSAKSKKK